MTSTEDDGGAGDGELGRVQVSSARTGRVRCSPFSRIAPPFSGTIVAHRRGCSIGVGDVIGVRRWRTNDEPRQMRGREGESGDRGDGELVADVHAL